MSEILKWEKLDVEHNQADEVHGCYIHPDDDLHAMEVLRIKGAWYVYNVLYMEVGTEREGTEDSPTRVAEFSVLEEAKKFAVNRWATEARKDYGDLKDAMDELNELVRSIETGVRKYKIAMEHLLEDAQKNT